MALDDGKASPFMRKERNRGDALKPEGGAAAGDRRSSVPSSSSPHDTGSLATGGAIPAETPPSDVPDKQMSVIGRELTILGQEVRIASRGKIRVDGEIHGDVFGTEVVIADIGKVVGEVAADNVTVYGSITGTIRGSRVRLLAGSKVQGDVHHETLSVHENAQIEGRVSRARDGPEASRKATDTSPRNASTHH